MAETIFFTADTHFGHAAMIRHCGRPFADADEMNEAIIVNWNERVKSHDRVYHLGDFSFLNSGRTIEITRRLNGFIHLVRGNHDRLSATALAEFESVSDLKELRIEGQKLILCHYAMLTWNLMHHGSWMLHGHSHGSLPVDSTKKRLDVGIDAVRHAGCASFSPIAFEEVRSVMQTQRNEFVPVDHHRHGSDCDEAAEVGP